jgi:hypothetical protein
MRRLSLTLTLVSTVALSPAAALPQGHQHSGQHSLDQRRHTPMDFDQHMARHRFSLYEDGGAIEVSVNDPADTANLEAIRSHLPHIAEMFGAGNFDAPMEVHAQRVPGTAEMARLKDKLSFKYVATPRGGRVDIVTTDREALAAVHAFLKFQIEDHKTGDAVRVTRRPA